MMKITHIAGYKFIALDHLEAWKSTFLTQSQALRGTILLSPEGININVAGEETEITAFKTMLFSHQAFSDMTFHETDTKNLPYQRMKVKIKKEIITFRNPDVQPTESRAPSITAAELKTWLDENRDFTLLDTRNDYEIAHGTFKQASHLNIKDFSEFAYAAKNLDPNKTIVMFCTGGVRCEKAGLHLLNEGFQKVYQLEGGILKYFHQVGQTHYEGKCFVFDERIALDANLLEG
jgi:UPF0176 protein